MMKTLPTYYSLAKVEVDKTACRCPYFKVSVLKPSSNEESFIQAYDNLSSALNHFPDNYGDYIITYCDTNGSDKIIYAWNKDKHYWVLIADPETVPSELINI